MNFYQVCFLVAAIFGLPVGIVIAAETCESLENKGGIPIAVCFAVLSSLCMGLAFLGVLIWAFEASK